MNVYILEQYEYEETYIKGVFTTRELAQELKDKLLKRYKIIEYSDEDDYDIMEYKVDVEL